MKSLAASYCESATRSGKCWRSGTANGGTANSCSPRKCSTSRLVTIILSFGQAVSRSATCTAAFTTCSKLSNSSHFLVAPNQRGRLGRQVVGVSVERLERRKISEQARNDELKEMTGML